MIFTTLSQPKEDDLISIAKASFNLTSVDLTCYTEVTERVIEWVARENPTLRALHINSLPLSNQTVRVLTENCPELEFFYCERMNFASQTGRRIFDDALIETSRKPRELESPLWHFIKAIQNGFLGHPVLTHITKHHVDKLSTLILDRASEIAEKQTDITIGMFIEDLRTKVTQNSAPMREEVMEVLLTSIYPYCGYHPYEHIDWDNRDRRWDLMMVAQQGGKQKKILFDYLLKTFPTAMTSITLQRAYDLVKEQKDSECTQLLYDYIIAHCPAPDLSRCKDTVDVQMALASNAIPSGYCALGDLPERAHWKALTQQEIDSFTSGPSLQILSHLPLYQKIGEEDPFLNSIRVVADDKINVAHNELRLSEYSLFHLFYLCIIAKKTAIQIDGTHEFQKLICSLIRTLLSTPSGRWLLLFSCRNPKKIFIREGVENHANMAISTIYLETSPSYNSIRLNGKIVSAEFSLDTVLFHELVHLLHELENPIFRKELSYCLPVDPRYDDLEEQYTISGVEYDCTQLGMSGLCQNMYHFEKGYPERYGHRVNILDIINQRPVKIRRYS